MKTQVAIIGGGPSGLLLGQLLARHGIDTVILERQSKDHVLSRIRAGVLERGLVKLLEEAGCADRLHAEALVHDGTLISFGEETFRVDFAALTGTSVLVYGQTEVTRDLYDAREGTGQASIFNVEDVVIHDVTSDHPSVAFSVGGEMHRLDCAVVAGCDGFHGVSRRTIPADKRTEFEKQYPFGWLGVLTPTPPVHEELIYAQSSRGFALCSMRNPKLSRYYIQCPLDDRPENWSDEAFFDELQRRIPASFHADLIRGESIEKSIAPLRSFVCEPMQWGRLFLCGDAAHIVPPTGAKGLNTAASDVHYLAERLIDFFGNGDANVLQSYSAAALKRVWKVERFSWWFSSLMHVFPTDSAFDTRMKVAELDALKVGEAAQKVMAENYVGLPY